LIDTLQELQKKQNTVTYSDPYPYEWIGVVTLCKTVISDLTICKRLKQLEERLKKHEDDVRQADIKEEEAQM